MFSIYQKEKAFLVDKKGENVAVCILMLIMIGK